MILQTGQLTQMDGATTNYDVQSNLDQTKESVAVPKYMYIQYFAKEKNANPFNFSLNGIQNRSATNSRTMGGLGRRWVLRSADMQISQSFQILHVHVHVVLKAHCQLNCNCVNFTVLGPTKKMLWFLFHVLKKYGRYCRWKKIVFFCILFYLWLIPASQRWM